MPFVRECWNVLLQLAPWLLLGTGVAVLLHRFVPAGWVRRRLQGRRGVVEAVALGVPLPLCSCAVVPTGLGLRRDGASRGATVGFLVSTPQTGVDSILVAASFLGWPFALMKVLAAGVTGVIAGWLADDDVPTTSLSVVSADEPTPTWRESFAHGVEILRAIWFWVVVGVVASAAVTLVVPEGSLATAGAWGAAAAGGIALGLSLPLYVCATASVPIAAALVERGLPLGAALVFLMAGPATNLGTIGAIHRELGRRTTVVYLGTIVAGSLAFAVLFEWLFPAAEAAIAGGGHVHGAWWNVAGAVVALVLFAVFAVDDIRRRLRAEVDDTGDGETVRVGVDGMTCRGCTGRLETALRQTDGVEEATVHLEPGEAVVRGSVTESTVREVVRASGFRDTGE